MARIAAILESVRTAEDGLRLSDLVVRTGAPKSSVHGLLRGLVDVGYLADHDGTYRVGPGLAVLLGRTGPQLLVEVAHGALEELVRETGETALLGLRAGGDIVYIDQVESPQTVRYSAPLYVRRPLVRTSMGKVHLAHIAPGARQRLLRAALWQEAQPAALRDFDDQLEGVRGSGVAYNRGETVPWVTAAAAGVWAGGRLVAAISVAGPTERVAPALAEIAQAVSARAAETSRLLPPDFLPAEPG